jgi:hypothetical protein
MRQLRAAPFGPHYWGVATATSPCPPFRPSLIVAPSDHGRKDRGLEAAACGRVVGEPNGFLVHDFGAF